MNPRVILAVTNDLVGDQRVHKVALSLAKFGFEPVLVGRRHPDSAPLGRSYPTRRFRLLFRKGPLFYLEYNCRLFLYLLFVKAGTFVANDLDTLPAAFCAAKIRRKRLLYDSHEYFTEVPELVGRPGVKRIWERIEGRIFPRLDRVYTVNRSIAEIYREKYGVDVRVVRNLPASTSAGVTRPVDLPATFAGHPVIIYQGAVNVGRGLEEMIRALPLMPEVRLLVAGDGDIRRALERQVSDMGLKGRVYFAGKVPFERLADYTRAATLGMSLEQDIGLNYHYALPNKLFDYMHAGLPVIVSGLPEIRRVVEEVDYGTVVDQFDPETLSRTIADMIGNPDRMKSWSRHALDAAGSYTWESEENVLRELYV
jgi:glycosyltransferase involved in cell wall biosynthesis